MTFNGFISYSHAADGRLAPAVQRGLHRLAKPWHRRRALWIFRDQTGLSVTPALWSSIQRALDGSDYFVLLASPEAARSPWVNREIEHWIATKSADQILPVVTDGEWAWDPERRDFTEESTAVPAALRGKFAEEPLFLDLRWARGSEHLSLQHSRFRDAIAQLAAPMHGVSKDELEGEDVRQHRRARRLRSGAVATLVVLTMLATVTSLSAVHNAERAREAAAEAMRQQQVAEEQRGSAERSAQEANRQQELAQQQQSLARQQKARAADAAEEAKRAEELAADQQRIADRAAAEARRQQRLADQAAKRTRQQEGRAEEATQRAQRMEREAKHQEQEARRQEREARRLAKVAEQKQQEAREAAEEARKQQAKADQQQRVAVSRRLTNQAKVSVGQDPKTALMLGAAAQNILPDRETRSEVSGVVLATSYTGGIDDVSSARYVSKNVLLTVGADGIVSLWNVADRPNPVRIARLKAVGAVTRVQLSPDGRTLVVVRAEGPGELWDVTDRARPALLTPLPDDEWVTSMAWRGDGKVLITGSGRGVATVWDTTDRARPGRLSTLTGLTKNSIEQIALSPDGRMVILDNYLAVPAWDLTDPADPVELRSLPGFNVASMAFNHDGSQLAVGEDEGTVAFYHTTPADMALPGPPPEGADPEAWEPVQYEFDRKHGLDGAVRGVAFSPDGRLLAAGDEQGTTLAWDMTKNIEPVPMNIARAHGGITELFFDPSGQTLVVIDTSLTATFWKAASGFGPDALATLPVPGGTVQATAFRPNGRSLLAAGVSAKASSWTVTDPARPVPGAGLTIHSGAVRSVAFSPDRRWVSAVGQRDGRLTVTNVTGQPRPVRLPALTTSVEGTNAMAFSPDGKILAVVADHTKVLLWNLADRNRPTLLATLADGVRFSTVLAFSPDGGTLVTGSTDRTLTLWKVGRRSATARLGTLAGHTGAAASVIFSPDGRTVVSGGTDNTAMLWDVTDRARPHRLAIMTGHGHEVTSLAFSADGDTLVTADRQAVAFLWDTRNPAGPIRLVALSGPDGIARAVVFKGDGRTLAIATDSETGRAEVTLWSYAKLTGLRADPAKRACAQAGRGLTAGEWARLIPEFPYRRTCP